MGERKHTPGPWRISSTGYSIKSSADDMPIVAQNPWGTAMREADVPRWLANADLIAAAPLMLEALRPFVEDPPACMVHQDFPAPYSTLRKRIHCDCVTCERQRGILAAWRAATGGEP